MDELYDQELKAIGQAAVPKALDRPHRGLVPLLKQEQRRREKVAARAYHWDKPRFDTPLARRRLRILNAIFLALSKRGHDAQAYEHNGEILAAAIVGDTHIGLETAIVGKLRAVVQHGLHLPAPDLPAMTPLALRLRPDFGSELRQSWQDDADGDARDQGGIHRRSGYRCRRGEI